MENVIERINWLIYSSGLEQKAISEESGVSTSTISRLTLGHQPITEMKLKNVIKLNELALYVEKYNK